ncbi:hypothetical protein ACG7TL_003941 [Trametes sanguinea]
MDLSFTCVDRAGMPPPNTLSLLVIWLFYAYLLGKIISSATSTQDSLLSTRVSTVPRVTSEDAPPGTCLTPLAVSVRSVTTCDDTDDFLMNSPGPSRIRSSAGPGSPSDGVMNDLSYDAVSSRAQSPEEMPDPLEQENEASVPNRDPSDLRQSSPLPDADECERQRLLAEAESSGLIPASREAPAVRLAYLQSVLGNIVDQQTVLASQRVLRTVLDAIELAGVLPDLSRPARSLKTAARRLGLHADDFITQLPVCTHCWKPYTVQEFDALSEPGCTTQKCPGIVYTMHLKRPREDDVNNSGNSSDNEQPGSDAICDSRRRPAKIQPWYSLVAGYRRYLMRPDFVDNLVDMSTYIDRDPVTPETVMNDIHDGSRFGQLPIGQERVVQVDGEVADVRVTQNSPATLARCDVGMSMTMSIDWFGIISGRHHSAGGVYVIFNNLRRAVRFLTHNVHQVTLISGPKEPSLEQLNNALLPLKWDLEQLYKGIIMLMYKREIPPRVYGGIELQVSDIEALRKVIGAAGHAHKTHPCNECLKHFLGLVKHGFDTVIVSGYLLDAASWRLFQELINSVQWPSGIGRLPKNLGENHSLQKADQWRCWCNITPTILWLIWRDQNDKIRLSAPPIPAQSNSPPGFRRSLSEIYKYMLYLSTAERLLARKAITLEIVRRGQRYLRKYCLGLLDLGVHLVINHHMAMHYERVFPAFGPAYGWWLFGFERCNGDQENVNHNGHDGGEMELTLMRNWVSRHRLHELLVSAPETFTPKERDLINHYLRPKGTDRGTLRQQLASFDTDGLILIPQRKSKDPKYTNLRKLITSQTNPYQLLLTYLQKLWPETPLVDDLTMQQKTVPLIASRCAVGLPFVYKNGLRFGSLLDNRSTKDRYALVDFTQAQVPCKLLYHFQVMIPGQPEVLCSVVRRMQAGSMIPTMPWDLYAPELGVFVVRQEQYHAAEVVHTSSLAAAVALVPMHSNRLGPDYPLWVVHSFDRLLLRLYYRCCIYLAALPLQQTDIWHPSWSLLALSWLIVHWIFWITPEQPVFCDATAVSSSSSSDIAFTMNAESGLSEQIFAFILFVPTVENTTSCHHLLLIGFVFPAPFIVKILELPQDALLQVGWQDSGEKKAGCGAQGGSQAVNPADDVLQSCRIRRMLGVLVPPKAKKWLSCCRVKGNRGWSVSGWKARMRREFVGHEALDPHQMLEHQVDGGLRMQTWPCCSCITLCRVLDVLLSILNASVFIIEPQRHLKNGDMLSEGRQFCA